MIVGGVLLVGSSFAGNAEEDAARAFAARFELAFDAHQVGDTATAAQIAQEVVSALEPWCADADAHPGLCGEEQVMPVCKGARTTSGCEMMPWERIMERGVRDLWWCTRAADADVAGCANESLALALFRADGWVVRGVPPMTPLEPRPAAPELPPCSLVEPVYTIRGDTYTEGLATAVRLDNTHVVVLTVGMPAFLPPYQVAKKAKRIELRDVYSGAWCGETSRLLSTAYVEPVMPWGVTGMIPAEGHRLQPLRLAREQVEARVPLYAPTSGAGAMVEGWATGVDSATLVAWAVERAGDVEKGLPLLDARGEVVGIVLASDEDETYATSLPALWHKLERALAEVAPLAGKPDLPLPSTPTRDEVQLQRAARGAFIVAHAPRPALPAPPGPKPPAPRVDHTAALDAFGWGDVPLIHRNDAEKRVDPEPPKGLDLAERQSCWAMVQVEPDGTPSRVEVAGCDPHLHGAVREAMLKWRWGPSDVAARSIVVVVFEP